MRKIWPLVSVLLIPVAAWLAGACDRSSSEGPHNSHGQSKNVGVLLLASHPVLHDLRDGFRERLDELGRERNAKITYDEKNAEGNAAMLNQLAAYFSAGNHDLVYAVGSDSALKLKSTEARTPVVFAGTPDPVRNGFVASLERPGGNLTGVRFLPPPDVILDVLAARHPGIRRVAVLRNPAELNSQAVAEPFMAEARKRQIEVGDFGVNETSQLSAVLNRIGSEGWQAVFVPNDNLIYQNLKQVAASLAAAGIPFVSVTDAAVKAGAEFSLGISYREMGRQAGSVAARIIFDNEKPAVLPVAEIRQGCLFVPAESVNRFSNVRTGGFVVTPVQ